MQMVGHCFALFDRDFLKERKKDLDICQNFDKKSI
jgi:hypothetical protein